MRDGGYRDPLAALRHRIADKRRTTPAPDAFLTVLRRALLTPERIEEIEGLGDRIRGSPETVDALSKLERELDALAATYEAARSELDRLAAMPGELVAPRPHGPPKVEVAADVRGQLLAAGIALGGTTEPWEPAGYVTRYASLGVPMLLAVRPTGGALVVGHLRTAVPQALPSLTVRLQRLRDSMLEVLGLAKEVELRVRSFDAEFWIEGEERTARALLGPEVRAAMRALRIYEPMLRVDAGVAELVWRYRWHEGADVVPRRAQELLDAIAAATVSV